MVQQLTESDNGVQMDSMLEAFRVQMEKLESRVDYLEDQLAQNQPPPPDDNSNLKGKEKIDQAAAVPQAITIDDAFQKTGGEEKLRKFHKFSKDQESRVFNLDKQRAIEEMTSHIIERKGQSLKNVNQPAQYSQSLESLYEAAERVHPRFKEIMIQLEAETGGVAMIPPLKGRNRAYMKALFKYRDGTPKGIGWHRLTDIVRATLEFEDIDNMYAGLKTVIDIIGENNVVEFNDRYQNKLPGGYRDLQLSIKVEGFVCELQLNTKAMLHAKMTTGHRNYEVARELKAAVQEGDLLRVQRALEFGRQSMGSKVEEEGSSGKDFESYLKNDKSNLMHTAARNGHSAILLELLQHGADVNARDSNGDTPLHIAVSGGFETCVWLLLDAGKARINVPNGEGLTAMALGFILLWTQPSEETTRAVITLADFLDHSQISASKATSDKYRSKKLKHRQELANHAAHGDYEKLVEDLKEFGNPDSCNSSGETAISLAVRNNHIREAELLLKYRASVKTQDGQDSLFFVAFSSYGDSVKCSTVVYRLLSARAPVKGDMEPFLPQLIETVDKLDFEEAQEPLLEYVIPQISSVGSPNVAGLQALIDKFLTIRKDRLGEGHPDVGDSYHMMANALRDVGNCEEAMGLYNKALTIRMNTCGEEDLGVADVYGDMGLAFTKQGKYDQATEFHYKALSLKLGTLGKEHLSVATICSKNGDVLWNQGNYDGAINLYIKTVTIQKNALGEGHLDVARTYNSMGILLHKQGKHDEAMGYYNKALAIRKNLLEEAQPSINHTTPAVSMVTASASASQSSFYYGDQYPASNAIDGNPNTFSHTHHDASTDPWWRVDLGLIGTVTKVVIWNRHDGYYERITGAILELLDSADSVKASATVTMGSEDPIYQTFDFPCGIPDITSVRIRLEGSGFLHMGLVEVFGHINPERAYGAVSLVTESASATQSSNYVGAGDEYYPASNAIDGNKGTHSHTNDDCNPWWRVDLGLIGTVTKVVIWNRHDACWERITGGILELLDSANSVKASTTITLESWDSINQTFDFAGGIRDIACVRVRLEGRQFLHIGLVEVFGQINLEKRAVSLVTAWASASQSSNYKEWNQHPASNAIDGDKSTFNCTGGHSAIRGNVGTTDPWWRVDLGLIGTVTKVVIWNRHDSDYGRIHGGILELLDSADYVKASATITLRSSRPISQTFDFGGGIPDIANIRVRLVGSRKFLHMGLVEVFGSITFEPESGILF